MSQSRLSLFGALCVAAALTACGGGGGGSAPTPTPAPAPTPSPSPSPSPAPAPSTLVTSVAPFSYPSNPDLAKAMEYLNAARGSCGFGLLAQNTKLDQAANDQALYLTQNAGLGRAVDHTQVPSYPGYTALTAGDRAQYRGYGSTNVSEGDTLSPIGGIRPMTDIVALMGVTYHMQNAFGTFREVGFSVVSDPTQASSWIAGVTNYGTVGADQQPAGNSISSYPCEGTTVAVGGHGPETPDPIPGRDWIARPGGTPILFQVRTGQVLAITSFTLKDQAGAIVPIAATLTSASDPNKFIRPHQAVVIPDSMLTRGATYFVEASGTNNGQPWTQKFKFSVAAAAPN